MQFLTVGRLTEKKGIEYAIRAIAKVRDHHPDVRYNIIGEGELKASLSRLIETLECTDIITLSEDIEALEAAGRPTEAARAGWWHKITAPLSTLLMPLLASVAAFGLARSGQVLLRATIGMALGFAYFVVENAALAMGSFGGYPPLLAAWAPFMLFLLIGETVLIRTEE